MRLIVGLGNPGPKYQDTPHNIGFMVVAELGRRAGAHFRKGPRPRMETAKLTGDPPAILMRPLGYMNRSGPPVVSALAWFAGQPGDLLVVCDDVNLPFGRLRFRQRGGSGGQKGLASIIEALGTEEFARLRIGVGGGEPGADVAGHVLSRFTGPQLDAARKLVADAADAVEHWLREGIESAMNRYNQGSRESDPATPSGDA